MITVDTIRNITGAMFLIILGTWAITLILSIFIKKKMYGIIGKLSVILSFLLIISGILDAVSFQYIKIIIPDMLLGIGFGTISFRFTEVKEEIDVE